MKKLLFLFLILSSVIIGQQYPVKDTTVTAMEELRRLAGEIDNLITDNLYDLDQRVKILELDNARNKQDIDALYDSIAALRGVHIVNLPGAVTDLDTSGGCTTTAVGLGWTDVLNDQGYIVEKRTGSNPWSLLALLSPNSTSYTAVALTPNTFYSFRVTGYNTDGNGIADTILTKTRTAGSAPAQVTALVATDTNTTSIILGWSNVASETGYQIQRKLGNQAAGSFAQIGTTGVDITVFSSTNLTASTTYTYRVRAVNAIGDGPWSDTLRIATNAPPPTIVRRLLTAGTDNDDFTIWVHPTASDSSLFITSDKSAGRIFVFDVAGNLIQTIITPGLPGNIDIRYQFNLDGTEYDIVAANDRTNRRILVYKLNAVTRRTTTPLSVAGSIPMGTSTFTYEPYGFSLYRSPYDGEYYAFVVDYRGRLAQWHLADSSGSVVAEGYVYKRRWDTGNYALASSIAEAMVCDDETGRIYVSREQSSVAEYMAEPDSATTLISTFGAAQRTGDLEGITIYYNANGTGYIIVSDQAGNRYLVYTRQVPHTFVKSFTIAGAAGSDGIDVMNMPLGSIFPYGVFGTHSGDLDPRTVIIQDYASLGLDVNTTYYDVRKEISPPVSDSLFSFVSPYIFANTTIGAGNVQATFRLTNDSGVPLVIGSMSGLSAPFTMDVLMGAQIVNPGETYNFSVNVNRDVTAGTYRDTINIQAAKLQKWAVQITLTSPIVGISLRPANVYIDFNNGNNAWNGTKPFYQGGVNGPRKTLPTLTNGYTYAFRDSVYYYTGGEIIVSASNIRFTNYWNGPGITPIDPNNRANNSNYRLPVLTPGSKRSGWTAISGQTNKWQCSGGVGAAIFFAFADSIRWGRPRTSLAACVEDGDYFVSGSVIQTYCTSDPDTRFESIDVVGSGFVIDNTGDNNVFDHLDLRYGTAGSFMFEPAGVNVTLRDSRAQFTGDYGTLIPGGSTGGSEGVYMHASQSKLINTFVSEHTHHSVFMYNTTGTPIVDITVDSCLVTNGHYNYFDSNGGTVSDIKIRYNICRDEPYEWYRPLQTGRNGGFWIAGGCEGMYIAYNLIYDMYDRYVVDIVNSSTNYFYNNTFIASRPDNTWAIVYTAKGNNTWKNNLFWSPSGGAGVTLDATNKTSATNLTNYNRDNYNSRNFRPLSNSNLVNAGVAITGLTKDLDGNPLVGFPDVGGYEYQTGGGSVPVTTTLTAVSNTNGQITVSASESVSAVDSVRIYGGLTPNPTTWLGSIAYNGNTTFTSLTGGRIYYYRGKNLNDGVLSPDYGNQVSDTAKVTISTPTATVTAGELKTTITLNVSSVDSVRVYRGLSANPTTWIRTLVPVTTFKDTPLVAGTTYNYRFRSLVYSALSSYSSNYTSAVTGPVGVPTTLSLTAGIEKITIGINETGADSVRIYRGLDANTMVWIMTVAKTSTTDNTGLTAGVTYYYRAKNIISGVLSDFSAALSAVPTSADEGESGGLKVWNAEAGNTSDWTFSTIDTSSTFTAETEAKQNGNYGYKIWMGYGGGNNERYYDFTPQGTLYYRFYFYIPSGFTGYTFGSRTYFGGVSYTTSTLVIGMMPLTNGSGAIAGYRFDSSLPGFTRIDYTANSSLWSADTWHYVEFYYTKGTGADGVITVWVDGVQVVNDTGNNFSTVNANRVSIGPFTNFAQGFGNRKYIYIDDVKLSTIPIGAYPSTD